MYRNPDDMDALGRLQRLLGATVDGVDTVGAAVSQENWRRLVQAACDELFDDPEDCDARDRLILLMAARAPNREMPTNPG
ncbi:MAG: hypothetical protein ACSLE3_10505 [Microbacteriaceae bacterium]